MVLSDDFQEYRVQGVATSTTTTVDTRSELTFFTDSKANPAIKIPFEKKRDTIRSEMFDSLIQHPSLFEQLYCESLKSTIDAARLFHLVMADMRPENRWTAMPRFPANEKEVQNAFMEIARNLKVNWLSKRDQEGETSPHSDILDTSQKLLLTRDGACLRPDVFFEGSGTLFPTLPPRNADDPPPWSLCIAPGDLKTTKNRDAKKLFGQLGTYAEQVFAAQENRRFVPTFRLDECKLHFFTFDRSGAITGHSIDYHSDPTKLCALVQTLSQFFEDSDVGFDPSIYHEDGLKYIKTSPGAAEGYHNPPSLYIIEKTLFHSSNIRGSGTIYWLTRKKNDEDENARYIIKDSWIVGGYEYERELLKGCIGDEIKGVASIIHMQNVEVNGKVDSVSNNRPKGVSTPTSKNRIHTRVVLRASEGAKLLDRFSNTLELLNALRDAVSGHHRLHASGVLHGGINPTRILIQPGAEEGNRGVLFDLQCGMRTDSRTKRPLDTLGSLAFYSRSTLDSKNLTPPFHLDDLESFYYVLCYMVSCHSASGSRKPGGSQLPISKWFSKSGGDIYKGTAFAKTKCPFTVDPSFETPVSTLVENLFRFFCCRPTNCGPASGSSSKDDRLSEDYVEFVQYIDAAIADLDKDNRGSTYAPLSAGPESSTETPERLANVEREFIPGVRDAWTLYDGSTFEYNEHPDHATGRAFNSLAEGERPAFPYWVPNGGLVSDSACSRAAAVPGTWEDVPGFNGDDYQNGEASDSFTATVAHPMMSSSSSVLPNRQVDVADEHSRFDSDHVGSILPTPYTFVEGEYNYSIAAESLLYPSYPNTHSDLMAGREIDGSLPHLANQRPSQNSTYDRILLYSEIGNWNKVLKRAERPDSPPPVAPSSKRGRWDNR